MSRCAADGCKNKPWRGGAYCGPQCEWDASTEDLSPAPWEAHHCEADRCRYYLTKVTGNVPTEYEVAFCVDDPPAKEAERVFLAGLKALYGVEVER